MKQLYDVERRLKEYDENLGFLHYFKAPFWALELAGSTTGAWRLTVLVEEGYVSVEEVELPQDDPQEVLIFREGGEDHRYLCAVAASWLRSQGLEPTLENRRYSGGLADVVSSDRSVFVECGNTSVEKMLAAMQSDLLWLHVPFRGVWVRRPHGFLWRALRTDVPSFQQILATDKQRISIAEEKWTAIALERFRREKLQKEKLRLAVEVRDKGSWDRFESWYRSRIQKKNSCSAGSVCSGGERRDFCSALDIDITVAMRVFLGEKKE